MAEIWEDGSAFEELRRRRAALADARDSIEAARKVRARQRYCAANSHRAAYAPNCATAETFALAEVYSFETLFKNQSATAHAPQHCVVTAPRCASEARLLRVGAGNAQAAAAARQPPGGERGQRRAGRIPVAGGVRGARRGAQGGP